MNQSTAGRNGPPHREGPADENGATSKTTSANSSDYTARRSLPQECHADLGVVDDGAAVGS